MKLLLRIALITGLAFFFFLQTSFAQCTHSIDLTDTYGDGWNGGTVTVYVNGTPVLSGITLASGLGPATYTFTATTGNTINVTRIAAGSFPSEMRIRVYSAVGNIIAITAPVASPGTNGTASCPCAAPSNPPNPTAASNPACVSTTLNIMAPPAGETYYWQGTSCGTSTANPTSSAYPISATGTYYVRAQTNATSCWSAGCGSLLVTILASPAAPTNSAETNVTCSGFSANWTAITGADHYMLDVSTVTTFTSFVAGYNDLNVGNVLTYPVTGLTPGTTYYYRVRAVDICSQTSTNAAYQTVLTLTTPSAPTNNAETNVTCSGFDANWSAGTSIDHYMLDVSTSSTFGSFVGIYNNLNVGNVVTYPITGLSAGTTYYYRVRAVNACGQTSGVALYNTAATSGPLTAPTNNAETNVLITSFSANWSAIAGVDHYMLDVATNTGFTSFVTGYNNLNVGNVTTYAVNTNLACNTTYYYRVRAIDACGQASTNAAYQTVLTRQCNDECSGAISLTVGTTCSATNGASNNASQTLAALTCTSVLGNADDDVWYSFVATCSKITITVTRDATLLNYAPVVDLRDGCTGNSLACAYNATAATINYSSLTTGNTYYIRTYDNAAGGGDFDICIYNPILTAPTNNAETSVTCSSFNANWSAIAGVDHYMLDVSTSSGFGSFVAGYNNLNVGNVVTYPVTGLAAGTTYYYRVRAVDICGQASSNALYQTAATSGPLTAPTNNAETNVTCSSFNANWSAIAGVDHYMLDVSTSSTFGSFVAGYNNLNVGNVVTYPVTGLSANTTYYYRARAVDACGQASGNALYNTAVTSGPLTAPTNNTETNLLMTSFSANWSAIAGVDHYMLDVSTVSTFISFVAGYNNLNVGNVVTYSVTGLTCNTNYYFRVRAVDACGQASTNAAYQTVTTRVCNDECSGAITLTIGASCVNTAGTSVNASQTLSEINCGTVAADDDVWYKFVAACPNITISVDDAGSLNYIPVVELRNGCTGANLACALGTTSTAAVINYTTLTTGSTYYIRTYDHAASSNGTFNICIYNAAPANPTNSAESNVTCTSFDANWTSSAGATSYRLDVSTSSAFGSFVGIYNDLNVGNVLTYSVSGLASGTNYYYRVRAVNSCGQTSGVNTYQLVTTNVASAAPTAVSVASNTICTGSSVVLTKSGGTLGTGATWTWYSGNCGGTLVGTGTSITVTPGGTTTYYVRAEGGCTGNTACASITMYLATCYTQPTSGSTTYTTCSGLYTDNGGSANNYPVSNTSTVTFTPSAAGQKSQISFISFATESSGCTYDYDWLKIYDGPTTSSTLLGCYSSLDNDATGLSFLSTHASGSLTFQWKSDPASVAAGWIASVSCCDATISTQPSDLYMCVGGSASFSLAAAGSVTGYQWQVSTDGGTTWSNITGMPYSNFTTNTLNINPAASSMNGYKFRCQVICSCSIYSNVVNLVVNNSAPVANSTTAATAVGSYGFFANWTSSAASSYYLDVSTSSGFGSFVAGYNNLNVGNVTTYPVTGLNCNTIYYYRVRVYNGCGTSANSNTTSLTTSSMCNDNISGAYALPNTNYYPQTVGTWTRCSNVGATNSGEPATPSQWTMNNNRTVWFKFTATGTAQSVSTNYTPFASPMVYDPRIAIYSSSNNAWNGTLTLIAANDNLLDDANGPKSGEFDHTYYSAPGTYKFAAVGATGLTIGNTYFIRIDAEQGDIYVATNRAPDNDACASAINAILNTVYPTDNTSSSLWSNLNTPDFSFDCSGNESQENLIYYKFTPALTGTYFITQWDQVCDLNAGTQFVVFNPGYTCSTYPNMLSGYNTAAQYTCSIATTADRSFSMDLTAGLTYYFVIDGSQGDECQFNFAITKDVPMPVGLIDFSAECENRNTTISWKTGTETNNNFFSIEKSEDGQNYTILATVKGAGTSTSVRSYIYVDQDPYEGTTYYRLSQTDYNGSSKTFSPVISNCDGENGFSLNINGNIISDGTIPLTISSAQEGDILVVLTDALGREVYSKVIVSDQGGQLVMLTPHPPLPPGLYIVTASNRDEYISRKMVVK